MKTLRVLKVEQPIGEFYIGAIPFEDLLEISMVDIREFEEGNPDSIDGLQRDLSKPRLKSLREYVNLEYATFPTSVLLAINEKSVEVEAIEECEGLYTLNISDFAGDDEVGPIPMAKSAFVIDGQHRLAGLQSRAPGKGPFEVNVSIFVGADIADQAEIFSRVNLAQTKVNKSLTYDLLDYSREKSPFKVAHDITVALNRDPKGPFFRKIKRLGKRTPGLDGETLAQATVVNGLLRHLPPSQELERSKSLFGLSSRREARESWRDRIFVDFYRDDDPLSMLKIVTNYFQAVADRWEAAWLSDEEGVILSKTTGYNALIRFMKDAYLSVVEDAPRVVQKHEFAAIFDRVLIPDGSLTRDNYLPGSTGAGRLYNELVNQGLGLPEE
jgi:DGQHR domain-containing protein